ncbi:STAS domain-containing protein [Ralstonia sp. RL]|uniref:STAS domain-containing protein n=1 Tax=Ralstonia sp. RL TaxID=1839756 RepID=UPI000A50D2AB|nr:STAS domain-containing protein [Ralstonia sp. RL]
MNAETERKDGARPLHPLRIEGEMTIYQAAELKQTLASALRQGEALEIDLSAVGEIDAAGIQLLIAAKKSAQAAGKELRLVAHSDAVVEAFELLDIGGWFGDPLVMAPQAASHSN